MDVRRDRYVAVALRGVPQRYAAFLTSMTVIPGPGTAPHRLLHGERLVHNIDLASEDPYRAGDAQRRALVDIVERAPHCRWHCAKAIPYLVSSRSIVKKFARSPTSKSP